jgi:plastocyanin
MRVRSRWLLATVGLVALTTPILTASVARADENAPKSVSVDILGSDHFVRPGLLTNDYRFPDNIVIRQGGTITFHNKTNDAHTISLVAAADVPTTTDQVDNCELCGSINGAFGISQGPGLPHGAQLDNGLPADDDGQADADTVDTGAIATISPGLLSHLPPDFPILVEDFDTPSHTNTGGAADTVGDATLIDTSNPNNGVGFATQRTIVVSAAPGVYHYICTLHAWMQGTIKVVASNSGSEHDS